MKKMFFCFLIITTISLNGAQPSSSPTGSSESPTPDGSPELSYAIAPLRPFYRATILDDVDCYEAQKQAIREGLLVPTPCPCYEQCGCAALPDTQTTHSAVVGSPQAAPTALTQAYEQFLTPPNPLLPLRAQQQNDVCTEVSLNAQRTAAPESPWGRYLRMEDAREGCYEKKCGCTKRARYVCAFLCCLVLGPTLAFLPPILAGTPSCRFRVDDDSDVTNDCWIASGITCNSADTIFESGPFPGITQGNILTDLISDTLKQNGYNQSNLCVQPIYCGNLNCSPNYNQTTEALCWSALTACNVQSHNTTAPATGLRKRLAAKFAAKID